MTQNYITQQVGVSEIRYKVRESR